MPAEDERPAHFTGTAYEQKALERARERAATVLDGLDSAVGEGVEVETTVLTGPPARALVQLAQERDATEIAVGSRGFGGLRGAVLGSTSHALLHESDRPVLVIAPRAVEREARRQAAGGRADRVTIWSGTTDPTTPMRPWSMRRARSVRPSADAWSRCTPTTRRRSGSGIPTTSGRSTSTNGAAGSNSATRDAGAHRRRAGDRPRRGATRRGPRPGRSRH
jgi:Universal stress protein family